MKRKELTNGAGWPNLASRRMGHTIRMKKNPNHTLPYALFYIFSTNQPFVAFRGWLSYIIIITYPCRLGQTLRINSPHLTYAFTMFTYQPYTVARMNYTIFMAIRTARSKSPCNPNTSRISRMAIRSIRIHYVPSSTVRTKLTVREPEQSEKMSFGYKSRRISHSSSHFLITLKNGIHVDQRNRNDCSRHGASSMCSSSPWNRRRRTTRRNKREKQKREDECK